MDFILLAGGVVLVIIIVNLSGRVSRLEKLVQQGRTAVQLSVEAVQKNLATPSLTPIANYVTEQTKNGANRELITAALLEHGWKREDIDSTFATLNLTSVPHAGAMALDPTETNRFITWIKEDWLLKLGALLILIGFGWFTTYAFLHNWIGPLGRITIGITLGALCMVFGWWRMQKYLHQGGIFLAMGSTIILLTTFAARIYYDFFTPLSALGLMFFSTVFVAAASIKYKSKGLALIGLILAGVAPLLTGGGGDYVSLFAYLFVVVLGAVWVVTLTGQRDVIIAALLMVALYSLPHLSWVSGDRDTLLFFAYAFAAVFFATNTAGILKLNGEKVIADLITAAGNGLFLLVWIMNVAPKEWQSLIIAAWMVVFSVGAFLVFKVTQKKEAFYVYAGVGIAYLAAATSAELSGTTLTIAFTIEATAIAVITHTLLRDAKVAVRMTLLMLVPFALSIESLTSSLWHTSIFHKDFFVLAILAAALCALGLYFMEKTKEKTDQEVQSYASSLLILGSIYVYALIWLSLQTAFVNDDTAVMISLLIYTVIGLFTYFQGMALNKKGLKIYGGVLLGLVVGRLLLVEVWKMELTWRIITFFAIGALLISTAFLGKKK